MKQQESNALFKRLPPASRGVVFLTLATLLTFPISAQDLTQKLIDDKVAEIAAYLRARQSVDGSYSFSRYRVGPTALAVLALRTAGVPKNDPVIQKACGYLATHASTNTYEEGLVPCALEKIDPRRYRPRIEVSAKYLRSGQGDNGAWGYTNTGGNDESCSQYAILGLAAAERCGVKLSEEIKKKAIRFYKNAQRPDGGWAYRQRGRTSTVSMTCAGLASLVLMGEEYETVLPTCGEYMINPRLKKGLTFLAKALPGFMDARDKERWRYYALYGLERTGIFMNLKTIGNMDWYREGCRNILSDDKWRDNVVDAAFALLFITRNGAPYAITKWRWRGDWNNDHYDVSNWVDQTGKHLDSPLDWQECSLKFGLGVAARSSMIFLNGHQAFRTTKFELDALRKFLAAGGVIVAEGCCGSDTFNKSFAKIIETHLFPKKKLSFKKLSPNHPVLNNANVLTPDEAGIWMLGRGCGRKQVFLLRREISCSYNGDQTDPRQVERARKVGLNLLLYALGRRAPRKKFVDVDMDRESLLKALTLKAARGDGVVFKYENPWGRLKHDGEWDTDPNFFPNLKTFLDKTPSLPRFDEEVVIDPETEDLFGCAVVWITGHGVPKMSQRAMANLRRYVRNGGTILAEACCSDEEFDAGFRKLMKSIFPARALTEIPQSDSIYSTPYPLRGRPVESTSAYKKKHNKRSPTLYGVPDGDRWGVVYCPIDYSCAVEGDLEEDIVGLKTESALPLIANILSAAMRVGNHSVKSNAP